MEVTNQTVLADVRVFIPTYRRPTMLPRALKSLIGQTHQNWVAELHNDDPSDSYPAKLLAEINDSRIKLVTHTQNLGGTKSFDLFFRKCDEAFSSILEDDNWWEPEFLSHMLKVANDHLSVSVIWSNMYIWREIADKNTVNTGKTTYPISEGSTFFNWGCEKQLSGALHSNGAALYRSQPDKQFRIPSIPFAHIEPFRERTFPHPILLVHKPLANFNLTLETERSLNRIEWGIHQALLTAIFFRNCPWDDKQLKKFLNQIRETHQDGLARIIDAMIADPRLRRFLKFLKLSDFETAFRGFIRRPLYLWRLIRLRTVNPEIWAFLEKHSNERWTEYQNTRRDHSQDSSLPN